MYFILYKYSTKVREIVSSDVLTIVIPYIASISYLACIKRTIINNEIKKWKRKNAGMKENRWMNERTNERTNEREDESKGENEIAKVEEK